MLIRKWKWVLIMSCTAHSSDIIGLKASELLYAMYRSVSNLSRYDKSQIWTLMNFCSVKIFNWRITWAKKQEKH